MECMPATAPSSLELPSCDPAVTCLSQGVQRCHLSRAGRKLWPTAACAASWKQPAWQSSCAEAWLPKSMGVAVQELERGTISMLMQQLVTPLAGALEDQLRARAASTCLPGALEYLTRARPQAVTAGLISGRSASSPREREGSSRGCSHVVWTPSCCCRQQHLFLQESWAQLHSSGKPQGALILLMRPRV